MKRLPSDYVRTNIRLTSQPMEEAENDEQTRQALAMMHADEVLMFSSDYPHWDFDSPLRAFPKIEKALQRRIFSDTARELYGLPAGA
jgi:predicted TIM-barrel fold metal-dependent hydrolase